VERRYFKTVHLVGAQKSNYPWGFENRLIPAFEAIGCKIISTDFRQQRTELAKLLAQPADVVLVCRGDGISPQLLRSTPCITALWYAEQIGTMSSYDGNALARRDELKANVHAFDYVFTHDQANIEVHRSLGAKRVSWAPCALVNPDVNKKISAKKKHDVVFVGTMTPYRQGILAQLKERGIVVHTPSLWNPEELNKLFNKSRIVLNIHLSHLPNTETRVAEVLGAGSFLISEELSSPDLLKDGEHFVSWKSNDINILVEKIEFYLAHEAEREIIAERGHRYACEHLTVQRGAISLLDRIDFNEKYRLWSSYALGILFNERGEPTLRLDEFYAAVASK
jgi:hypothetical protein